MNSGHSEPIDIDRLWDYNQPAATEQRFRDLLPALKDSPSAYAELLTQIARAQGLQRRFVEAHAALDEAQDLLSDDRSRAAIRYLLERGRVFNSANQPAQARPLFLEAWQRALAANEPFYAIDAAHMLGIVEPPEQQLAWNLKALNLAEQTADERAKRWLGSLYNNIGWTYHDQGEYAIALDYFQKAVHQRELAGNLADIRIARWCVARTLRSLQRIAEALALQHALLAEYERDAEQSGYVYEEVAECYLALDQPAAAQPYFALAYAELAQDPWLVEREPARLERLRELGNV